MDHNIYQFCFINLNKYCKIEWNLIWICIYNTYVNNMIRDVLEWYVYNIFRKIIRKN